MVVQWLRLHASNASAVGLTLVREIRSHMPCSMAKKKKKKGFPGDSHVQSHLGSDVKKRKPWPLRWLMFTLFAL